VTKYSPRDDAEYVLRKAINPPFVLGSLVDLIEWYRQVYCETCQNSLYPPEEWEDWGMYYPCRHSWIPVNYMTDWGSCTNYKPIEEKVKEKVLVRLGR
jgi:hypothetical protein